MVINKLIKVKDEKSLYRDRDSKAIVTNDNAALLEYKRAKEKRHLKNNKILQYENDINRLKDEVIDIKDTLKQILDKLNSKG
tara:strand:- start:318 stop:563 length:246 start_codon:yes stop_codon:yes gene_type:complete